MSSRGSVLVSPHNFLWNRASRRANACCKRLKGFPSAIRGCHLSPLLSAFTSAGSGDPRRTKRRTARSGDPRRTIQIRNENSRDQRAVKTNFAACHGRTDYSRPHILPMHGGSATSGPSDSQSIYLNAQYFLRIRDDSRVPRFRGLNSWVLHLAETDLEGRGRAAIIRRRLNLIAKPQLVGLQCPGDDFRGSPVEPIWPRD